MDRLISEIAVRCDDVRMQDFTKSEYERALHRANRVIAKRYSLFQKVYVFKLSDYTNDLTTDVILDLSDMKSESIVWVNDIKLVKKSNDLLQTWDINSYYLDYKNDEWHFNYLISNKSFNDEITINYIALPNVDSDESEYIIPSNYEEEQIEEAMLYLSTIGMARFKEDKLRKYERIYRLHKNNDDYNKFNVPSREWVEIQPFKFP